MGVIYELVHLDRCERYDLDKFGNRGLGGFFPYEPFTLHELFGSVESLAEQLVAQSITPDHAEHWREIAAPDIWDWAGPDGRLQCVCDVSDNDIVGFYQMPETGSRMFPAREGYALLRAYQRWRIAAHPYRTWDVDARLLAYVEVIRAARQRP